MKFEEKLMKLRKEKALSQEELGEKLNVTRQTVSKWELGQTKPDSEKIMEIAKLFNVSADELLNEESEDVKAKPLTEEGANTRRTIIIVALVIALIALLYGIVYSVGIKKNEENKTLIESIFSNIGNLVDNTTKSADNMADNMKEEYEKEFNNMAAKIKEEYENNVKQTNEKYGEYQKSVDESKKQGDIEHFNSTYKSLYTGVQSKFFTGQAIKEVIQDNLNNERKITVKYKDTKAKESKELTKLISKLNKSEYLITYEYDDEGYISQMNIEDV